MRMPFFLNAFSSSAEMSSSSSGTTRGSTSRIVTSVPNVRKMDANSTPTAPAPTTTRDFGIACNCRISRFVRMVVAVDLDAGQRARFRSGGHHGIGRFKLGCLAVFFDRNAPRTCDAPPASDRLNFVLPEEAGNSARVLLDDFILAREHRGPVDLDILHFESEFLGALEIIVDIRVMQEDLRGDAADVQASATEKWVLFHDCGFQAPLAGANRRDISSRPAPDDHEIVFRQASPPLSLAIPLNRANCCMER